MLSAPHPEHLERLVRDLHAPLHRHDLRGVVGPHLVHRDPARLRRRGRQPSPSSSALIILITARLFVHPLPRGPAPALMVLSWFSPLRAFSLFRLSSSAYGPTACAAARAAPHHHPADLPRRHASISLNMMPPFWQTVTLFNPVVYLINGFRWSFYGVADVNVGISLAMTLGISRFHAPRRDRLDLPHRLSRNRAPKARTSR